MKKFLLSLAAAAVAFGASADKVVFIAADAQPFYDGDATTIINIPNGYYLTQPNAAAPKTKIAKSLSSSFVKIDATGAGNFGFAAASKASKCYSTSGSWRWYTNQAMTFTPAKGITLKNINIRTQRLADNKTDAGEDYVYPITKNTADTKITFSDETDKVKSEKIMISAELNSSEPVILQCPGQNRCYYFELEYEGTLAQPSMPAASTLLPYIAADEKITLTSDEGADIYYTLDGSVPTAASTKYTEPIALTEDAIVRAIAVKDDVESFPFYGEYYVIPAGLKVAKFDLSDYQTLTKEEGTKLTAADFEHLETSTLPCNEFINVGEMKFKDADALLSFGDVTDGKFCQIFKSWTFGNVIEYRPNDAANQTIITVPEGCKLSNVIVVGSDIAATAAKILKLADDEKGKFALCPTNYSKGMWQAGEDETSSVKFAGGVYINQIYVAYSPSNSSVATIAADENAPVEFYNLQGVRVANPENGIFIRRQGSKTSKVIIK